MRLWLRTLTTAASAMSILMLANPAVAESKNKFHWEGEEMFYSVEVSGAEAARASLRAGRRKKARGVEYIPVSGKAITHGFFAKSYPVDDRGNTFLDPKTFLPIKSDKDIREDGQVRTYKVRFDRSRHTASVDRLMKGKRRQYKRAIPDRTHDALSWIYDLRARPLNDGDTLTYFVFDGWKLSKLHVKVLGREKVWTPLKTYDSIKIDVEREIMNVRWKNPRHKDQGARVSRRKKPYYFATVHLTDDASRVPVRLFVTSKLGDSDFKLIKYTPPK